MVDKVSLTVAEQLEIALDALAFYADPETYHAIQILADRPTGGFDEDLGDNEYYDYPKPGKRAREAFKKLGVNFEFYQDRV